MKSVVSGRDVAPRRPLHFLTSVVAVSARLAGGASTPKAPPPRLTGDPLIDGPQLISSGPSKDKVLWQYRTAAEAMHRGQFQEAKQLLDDAILTISGIIGKDENAR